MKKTIIGNMKKAMYEKAAEFSIKLSLVENRFGRMIKKLRKIEPDISKQYSNQKEFNSYWEIKIRALHAFQCSLLLKTLKYFPKGRLTVVDIGDSAGTHMKYLKELGKDTYDIDTISVDLDPIAIEKIKFRGQKAVLCRAEDLDLAGTEVSLFTSFEMVEHLHDPALFFRRLAKKSKCGKMLITVPYMRKSRVGLHNVRQGLKNEVFAEGEHIFELNPADWKLLLLHSGWKITHEETYFQYPRTLLFISALLGFCWRKMDFEGFWGAILEKDSSFSECYKSWKE